MPYIITTSEPFDAEKHVHRPAFSRRAVVTLDEAREATTAIIVDGPNRYGTDAQILESYVLPEQGGTIGPLPDGTVIEVGRVEWGDLTEYAVTRDPDALAATLIDAYNTAQKEQVS